MNGEPATGVRAPVWSFRTATPPEDEKTRGCWNWARAEGTVAETAKMLAEAIRALQRFIAQERSDLPVKGGLRFKAMCLPWPALRAAVRTIRERSAFKIIANKADVKKIYPLIYYTERFTTRAIPKDSEANCIVDELRRAGGVSCGLVYSDT